MLTLGHQSNLIDWLSESDKQLKVWATVTAVGSRNGTVLRINHGGFELEIGQGSLAMKIEFRIVTIMFLASSLLPGCAALSSDGTQVSKRAAEQSGQPQASPVFRAQNHYEWVKRLKIAKSVEAVQGRSANPRTSTMMPIPLPPTSLEQYALVVDQLQQLAWLQGSESYGPFPLTNPDVAHLMNSVATAWQEQAAWESTMQQQQAMQNSPLQSTAANQWDGPGPSLNEFAPQGQGIQQPANVVTSEFDR